LKIALIGERILVKETPLTKEEPSTSVFIVPKASTSDNSILCVVVQETSEHSTVNIGDHVLLEKSKNYPTVTIDNTLHYFCKTSDILAKVD